MRKIISNEEKERISKRNQLIIGIVLILLMLFSTVGFAFSFGISGHAVNELEHKGVEFLQNPETGYWGFEVDGNQFSTIHNPAEVEDIKFNNLKTINSYYNQPLYFIGEEHDNAFTEIYRTLSRFALRIGGACFEDSECTQDYPIKTCEDNVIVVEEVSDEDQEGITFDRGCVYIKSSYRNQMRYIDAYLFDLLGVR